MLADSHPDRDPDRGTEPLRIGLLGLGTVGRAVAGALSDERWRDQVRGRGGPALRLVAVGVRDPGRSRGLDLPASVEVTDDLEALVARPDLDVVVELLGGLDPAERLIRSALERGRGVVTANKALLAARGASLEQLARRTGAPLRFEAAVGGGIPILTPLVRDLAASHIGSLSGIVNGTTNHILTAMTRDGTDYAEALAEAQRLGYAEADPTADVEGLDAAAKLAILARLAFGVWLDPERIPRGSSAGADAAPGITGISSQAIATAGEQGRVMKLLVRAERRRDGTIDAWVAPVAVPRASPVGATDGVTNIIEIDADPLGRVWFRGPGAGGPATSSPLLADLLALGRGEGATWGSLPEAPSALVTTTGWDGPWLDVDAPPGRSRYRILEDAAV
ncbi:MAG: homoserine dehydrogenase [Chloroflexota bacterium]|nr:homoserine dehydrogenase [Chloroflexota bacterium]